MTEDAFARRFYADRAELDSLGIHLSVDQPADGFSEQENSARARGLLPARDRVHRRRARGAADRAEPARRRVRYAEPLRLALQQLTWGRPSPLGSPAQRAMASASPARPAAGLSARLAKVDTAIYRRKRIEFEYFTMQSARPRCARSTPTSCCSRGPVLPRRLFPRARRRSASSGSRASAARSPTRPRRSTTSSARRLRPAPLRQPDRVAARRGARHRRIWISDRIAWHVERNFGRYGELTDADDGAAFSARRTRSRGCAGLGDRLRAARARPRARPSWPTSCTGGWTASSSCIAASRARVAPARRPPAAAPSASRRPPARGAGIRPERFARLVTLASVLIQAAAPAGASTPQRSASGCRCRPGAARGRLGAQRRQLRRRRLRALRRGAARRRDRGRPEPYSDTFDRPARLLPIEARRSWPRSTSSACSCPRTW